MNGQKICIITNGPISQSPRVVKEADALAELGLTVTVLSAQHMPFTLPLDRKLSENRKWILNTLIYAPVGLNARMRRFFFKLQNLIFRGLGELTLRFGIAEMAYSRTFIPQLASAIINRADLYIAHNVQCLPIAACASRIVGSRYGFDAEDLHCAEFPAENENSFNAELVRFIQAKYLKGCTYISASSSGIGKQLANRYNVENPTVVLNVFPLSEWNGLDKKAIQERELDVQAPITLYWYSQTISLDRGLQDAIRAVGKVEGPVELHMRGRVDPGVKQELQRIASECGAQDQMRFHGTVPPYELLKFSTQYDIGLCLETGDTLNRNLCATNKMFFYMLAGLAIIATDTSGQKEIMEETAGIGFVYPVGDVEQLAGHLCWFVNNREDMIKMKNAAYEAACTKWNWGLEQEKLIGVVKSAL